MYHSRSSHCCRQKLLTTAAMATKSLSGMQPLFTSSKKAPSVARSGYLVIVPINPNHPLSLPPTNKYSIIIILTIFNSLPNYCFSLLSSTRLQFAAATPLKRSTLTSTRPRLLRLLHKQHYSHARRRPAFAK